MREMGIHGVRRGRFVVTTVADPAALRPADLVDRDFTTTAPNQLWVADFTYVPTWSGFVYVAFIIDAYSRRFIGWRCATRMTTDLVLDALEHALWTRARDGVTDLGGLVHHNDAGSQTTFNQSTQHPDRGGVRGTTAGMDGYADWATVDEVAGSAADPSRGRAGVLAQGGRGHDQRGSRYRGRRVGAGGVEVVPRPWRHAFNQSGCALGTVPVVC